MLVINKYIVGVNSLHGHFVLNYDMIKIQSEPVFLCVF